MSENISIIKLNLRGTRFETLSSTLSKDPNSILGQIVKPDYPIPMKPIQTQDGYYFFDRSPATFEIILDYLSKDKLEEEIPKRELLRLEDEAKFFKLEKLEQEITSRLLQIEMEGKLVLNGHNNHDVKRTCDVIKFNVSGTIFQLVQTTLLNEYPDCLLTQYIKGTKEALRDTDGNIFLQKHVETYRLIFSFMINGKDFEGHRKQLIQGDINLLWTVRKEFVNLNLMDFAKHIYFYLEGRFKGLTFVSLKDKVWRVVKPSSNTLGFRIMNSVKSVIDQDGMRFLDISEKEMELLYKRWDNTIYPAQYQNGKYNKEPVSLLARKLGFISPNEVVGDN